MIIITTTTTTTIIIIILIIIIMSTVFRRCFSSGLHLKERVLKTMFLEMLWNYKSCYFLDFVFSRSPLCVVQSTFEMCKISIV
jgi:hypothetical protein